MNGAELPDGWFGKPWACFQGYMEAHGELLLFTDADTRHAPDLLGRAVGALEQERATLLTVAPRQKCVTFWERVIMPHVWLLLAVRYHPSRVNRATRPRDVIANGQFILVRRSAYERIGTHDAVKDEVAEDLALAQQFQQRGQRVYFAFAEKLMETRMYTNLGHLIEGWSKNVYLGGRASFPDEPGLRALVPFCSCQRGALLAAAAARARRGPGRDRPLAAGRGGDRDRALRPLLDGLRPGDADPGPVRAGVPARIRPDDVYHRPEHLAGGAEDRVEGKDVCARDGRETSAD